ncbi:LacI family DNA-binding transcriptional regulator [Limosilactobacillus sp.]|uniref:LacI family DNA-binding transcriptional regulator n=1 Tax=Limosilactobacillus sp. TaxID=2773925 RepID=UPI00345E7980
MKDIAKKAGVSLSTVSLVLNNKEARISEKTKEKIKRIAQQNNYHPNSAAVSLSKKISYNIGLIVPDITNPFFAQLTRLVDEKIRSYGYSTLFADSNNSAKREKEILANMASHGVDGVLLVPSNEFFYQSTKDNQEMIDDLGKPLILVNASSDMKVTTINFDNYLGAQLATQCLIDRGHREIAFIKGKDKYVNAPERYRGYLDTLKKNNLQFDPNLVYKGDYSIESGYRAAPQIFNNPKITGIVSSSDMMIFGLIKWSNEHHLDIFDRYSLIGFDNDPTDAFTQVPLASIDQELSLMVNEATTQLIQKINKKVNSYKHIIIKPKLIVRRSVRKNKN